MNIQIKRIYEDVSGDDGKRILVDRLWSRGLAKKMLI
jgi:DNA-3-methyladenine glycosylase